MSSSIPMKQAADLVAKADALTQKWLYFGNKWEDALDIYANAVNKYKIAKAHKEAADVFIKMINCHMRLNNKYECASCYVDAANCLRKVSESDAANCLSQAGSLYLEIGKFQMAAKVFKEVGELYEEIQDYENAIANLISAKDYFEGENQKTSAYGCLQKIAHLKAKLEKYEEAIKDFEECAKIALSESLLKFGAREMLFKAVLCSLAKAKELDVEIGDIKTLVDGYKDLDVNYPNSYEGRLIDELVEACEKKDIKLFASSLKEYDSIKKLDHFNTAILTKIRSKIENGGSEFVDAETGDGDGPDLT